MKGTRNRVEDLVRQARCEIGSSNRSNALGLMKRALSIDPDGEQITETILLIEKELTGRSSSSGKRTTSQKEGPAASAKPTTLRPTSQKEGPAASAKPTTLRPTSQKEGPAASAKPTTLRPTSQKEGPAASAKPTTLRPTSQKEGPAPTAKHAAPRPTLQKEGPAASAKPTTLRPTSQKEGPAASAKPTTLRPTSQKEGPAPTARPAAPRPTSQKEGPAASAKPTTLRPTSKKEGPAASARPTTPRPTSQKEGPAASAKPTTLRPTSQKEGPAASAKPTTLRPTSQKEGPAPTAKHTAPRPTSQKEGPAPTAKHIAPKPVVAGKRDDKSKKRLIEEIFGLSDSALKAGDNTGALECLKRAEVLSPENPEVKERMTALRKSLKAKIMIKTGYSRLAEEKFSEAVKAARKAFNLAPGVDGLEDFLSEIDACSRNVESDEKTADYDDAEVWVSRIRSRIQEGAFPLAAELAARASSIYPDHKLIRTFVERFTKMKLLQG